jgi:23S rRNA pseudouridine1911/1915/1917 synthase
LGWTVPAESAGHRLDRFLVSVLATHSRSQIQKLIADGHVRVTGREPRPNLTLRPGDRVEVAVPAPTPATVDAEAVPLDILYQDADLAVINKPAGMVVHPGAGHASGTLVNALLHHVPDLSGIGGELRPGIVHRLDRGTSGVMVVAKNDAAHQELSRQFHDREVEKEYIALVWGVVQAGRRMEFVADLPPDLQDVLNALPDSPGFNLQDPTSTIQGK